VSDSRNPDDVRELEDAGLAGYASGPDPAPPLGAAPVPEVDALRPYTSEELAQLTAGFSAIGLPADRITPYQEKVLASTRPAFELLGIGEALAEYGVGHGGGIDAMPAWVRLLAGAGVIGFIVVTTRAEFRAEPKAAAEGASA
jgi:hypothetical protein